MTVMLLNACNSETASNGISSSNIINQNEQNGVIERQVLKLSAITSDNTWLSMVIAGFNLSNEYYYVELNDYAMNGSVDFDEAVTKFNLDLITGNIPDVIILPARMLSSGYISKGLFADLNEFINNDSNFDRADYLPALFEALDRNGKIYEIPPMFSVHALQAKTSDVGTDAGWTLDEFAAFINTKPDAQHIIAGYTKRDFIREMIQYQFVSPMTGEVKFDRDEFKKILSVANRFPNDFSINDHSAFLQGAKDGDPLMISVLISRFFNIITAEDAFFREEVTVKGWPSAIGNGLMFRAHDYVSISQHAENSDGAWEFLKYALDHAKCRIGYNMPVNLSLLDEIAEDDYDSINQEMELEKSYVDKVMAILKGARVIARENPIINNIIDEEVGNYLSGQKSADMVADIIENRIGIYLAEQ